MSDAPFHVESNEGREVILSVLPALLEAGEPFDLEVGGELPKLRLRMTNDEAAELLGLLESEIGEWVRERNAARAVYALTRVEYDGERYLLDPSDPKHPDYAERLAELGDAARDRESDAR